MLNIEFGCGESPTWPGAKTCDIRPLSGVTYVCPAWEIDIHVAPGSVDGVFSRHFFEHLTFPQGARTLTVWHRILKPGGVCEIVVPNMEFHIQQWLQRKTRKEFAHACAGFWGWQRGAETDIWDIHKSGYDFQLLSDALTTAGFRNVVQMGDLCGPHLHVTCVK